MRILVHAIRVPFYVTMVLAFLGKFIFELNILIALIALGLLFINLMLYEKVRIRHINNTSIIFISVCILFWVAYTLIGYKFNDSIIVLDKLDYYQYGIISIINLIVFAFYSVFDEKFKAQIQIIIILVIIFLLFMVFFELFQKFLESPSRLPRIAGFDKNANLTGFKLNTLLLTLFCIEKEKFKKYIFIDILVGVAIIFTVSRGSMIVFALIQLFIFYKVFKRNKKELVIIMFMLAIGIYIGEGFIDNFNLRSDRLSLSGWEEGDYSNGRLNLLINGINTFLKNPLFGVGLGNSGAYGFLYGTAETDLRPHNTLVYILAETGIFPASILIISLLVFLLQCIKSKEINIATFILMIFITNFFNHNIHMFPYIYVCFLSIIVFNSKEYNEESELKYDSINLL